MGAFVNTLREMHILSLINVEGVLCVDGIRDKKVSVQCTLKGINEYIQAKSTTFTYYNKKVDLGH